MSRAPKSFVADRGVGLVEEAYALLRSASVSTMVIFYAGTVPFVAMVFYFWADMSRSSFAAVDAGLSALGVALAYVWMKSMQAWFCRRLWSQLIPEGDLPELRGVRLASALIAHACLQALSLPLLVIGLLFMVPLAWAYAIFQNATVLVMTTRLERGRELRELIRKSVRLSHWCWGANHLILTLVALAGFLVWMNLVMLALLLPQLGKWIFGIESVFTLFPVASLLNTSFLFATLLGSFLIMAPLTKSIYVLRCFYGVSQATGVDLLSRLAALRRQKQSAVAGAMVGLLVITACFNPWSLNAQEPEAQSDVVEHWEGVEPIRARQLDAAIESTLRSKPYQWRMQRDPQGAGVEDAAENAEKGFTQVVRSFFERMGESLKRLFRSIFQNNGDSRGEAATGFGRGGDGLLATALSVVSLLLIVGLTVWAVVQVRRRARLAGAEDDDGDGGTVSASAIDLEQDDLVATQLPEEEWMRLARQQIDDRKYRLAIRALFLGCLAHLGGRKLIQVARFKSNLDYGLELELKARPLPELRAAFSDNVGCFERVWYGQHEISREDAEAFVTNCEAIAAAGNDKEVVHA